MLRGGRLRPDQSLCAAAIYNCSTSWMCSRTPWRGRGRVRHVRHRGRRGRGREELIGGGGRGGGPRWGARGVEACTLVDRLTPYRPFTQALAATVRAWS